MVIAEIKISLCMDVISLAHQKTQGFFHFYFQSFAHFLYIIIVDLEIKNLKKQQLELLSSMKLKYHQFTQWKVHFVEWI
jgi:hypothetical protein